MKKFIFKRYLFLLLSMIVISYTILSFLMLKYFNYTYKEEIINVFQVFKNIGVINKNNYNIDNIITFTNIELVVFDKNYKVIFSTDKGLLQVQDKFKIIINKFIKSKNRNFYNLKNNIYYVNYFNNRDEIIIIYKPFKIFNIFFKNLLFYIISISIIYYIILMFFNKSFNKNIINPLIDITKEIYKIQDKNKNTNFKVYGFEEINDICNAVISMENNLENIVYKLNMERNKIGYILENMTEGFLIFDKNKNIFAINKMALKIFNRSEKFLGENILYYTQNIKILENMDIVLSTNQKCTFDMKTDDNKTYSIHIDKIQKGMLNFLDTGGTILIIDVTTERENEMMKQEFFSNISHELKTPITSIQGYSELLYNDFATSKEQEKEFLKIIQKETFNINNLINNILIISKLENKEIEINRSKINLRTIVEEIINSTKPKCIENNISIINNCNDIIINADYKKIHQLFNNLIVNAINYNKNNGYVEINCYEDDINIHINIKDSGIGIPLVDINRVFERFYRVEKGRSKELGGSGLGLAIVKHIVKYYNGKIKLKSVENFGSEFIIKIPKQNNLNNLL